MFCRYCGNDLPDDAKFCNGCGNPVDTEQREQEPSPKLLREELLSTAAVTVPDAAKRPVQKTGSKIVAIIAVVVLGVAALGVFGLRAANESAMKQQVPQSIYEDSQKDVIAHYDEVMAFPYGNDLGYTYGCHFDTFEIAKGGQSNTFHVTGKLEVMD